MHSSCRFREQSSPIHRIRTKDLPGARSKLASDWCCFRVCLASCRDYREIRDTRNYKAGRFIVPSPFYDWPSAYDSIWIDRDAFFPARRGVGCRWRDTKSQLTKSRCNWIILGWNFTRGDSVITRKIRGNEEQGWRTCILRILNVTKFF